MQHIFLFPLLLCAGNARRVPRHPSNPPSESQKPCKSIDNAHVPNRAHQRIERSNRPLEQFAKLLACNTAAAFHPVWVARFDTSSPIKALQASSIATKSSSLPLQTILNSRLKNLPRMQSARRSRKDQKVSSMSARSKGLAKALDEGTRKSHSMAESTQFIKGFFMGISTRSAFSQLVSSLYFVYQAMEVAFDATQDSTVKALDYQELRRLPSLKEDMAYYFGEEWHEVARPSPATQLYCNRVAVIARESPHLLIAHMYTRYLGDLFGGQMMRVMARTSLKLDKGSGTRFYEFDDISSIKKFIENWYTILNQLDLSEKQKHEIVEEANYVFALNIALFDEIQGSKRGFVRALYRLLKQQVKSYLRELFRGKNKDKITAS